MPFADHFKAASPRVLATLVRWLGDLDRAEDAFHDACVRALEVWPQHGVPLEPAAWLTTVARNRTLDALRRGAADRRAGDVGPREPTTELRVDEAALDTGIRDDQLRLLFTCCHPALAEPSRVALTLRTVAGLSTAEIARAFHEPVATTAQRLVRAKGKIREANIPYALPAPAALPERLSSVLSVVYLLFNEGYAATTGDVLIREDVCDEALRLGRYLATLFPREAEVLGLLALMRLHHARRRARVDAGGQLVTLEAQDRARWDRGETKDGLAVLDEALALRAPGPYQLQAAIAALHAQAPTADATDWAQILQLYDGLLRWLPTPTVALNRAVAVGFAQGFEAGLAALDALGDDAPTQAPLSAAARADFLRRLGRTADARAAYDAALLRAQNAVERRYLEGRRRALDAP